MKRSRAVATLAAVVLTVAACGDDKGDDAASSDEPTESTAAATSAPASAEASTTTAGGGGDAATFPVTVDAANGPVTVESQPVQIVSLSPTATEMLFAIGAGDQVIAVDDQSNYPAEAAAKSTGLSGYEPNVEAITGYEPDLVLIDEDPGTLGDQLGSVGIPLWAGPGAATFDDIYTQIEQLGVLTGHVAEAASVVAEMQAGIEEATADLPELAEPLTYFHELDNTYFTVTSNTFIGQVYETFGLRNIADMAEDSSDYPQLSPEFIVSQDPDIIFLADALYGESPDTVAARPGWGDIAAVVNGNVIPVDADIASRWGPRVVDFFELVRSAVESAATVPAG